VPAAVCPLPGDAPSLEGMLREPILAVPCPSPGIGQGMGLAICPSRQLLVTSDFEADRLLKFSFHGGAPALTGEPQEVTFPPGDRCFEFSMDAIPSGALAFTSHLDPPLLLVTDAGKGVVHKVDVVSGLAPVHRGFLGGGAAGAIPGARGVAVSADGTLIAVSAFKDYGVGDHNIRVFHARTEAVVRVIGARGPGDGQLNAPFGLRFSADPGQRDPVLVVADRENNRVTAFQAHAPFAFSHHVCTSDKLRKPMDVEQAGGQGRGWLITCASGVVHTTVPLVLTPEQARAEAIRNTMRTQARRWEAEEARRQWHCWQAEYVPKLASGEAECGRLRASFSAMAADSEWQRQRLQPSVSELEGKLEEALDGNVHAVRHALVLFIQSQVRRRRAVKRESAASAGPPAPVPMPAPLAPGGPGQSVLWVDVARAPAPGPGEPRAPP
jgi:hypothetical protein